MNNSSSYQTTNMSYTGGESESASVDDIIVEDNLVALDPEEEWYQ